MQHRHSANEYRLALWLKVFDQYRQDVKNDSNASLGFKAWLLEKVSDTKKEEEDDTCFLPASMRVVLNLQTCPDDATVEKKVEALMASEDSAMLHAWQSVHDRKHRSRFSAVSEDISLMVLDREDIPQGLLSFLSNDLTFRLIGCPVIAGAEPDVLYIVWHRNVPEGFAVLSLEKDKPEVEIALARTGSTHLKLEPF